MEEHEGVTNHLAVDRRLSSDFPSGQNGQKGQINLKFSDPEAIPVADKLQILARLSMNNDVNKQQLAKAKELFQPTWDNKQKALQDRQKKTEYDIGINERLEKVYNSNILSDEFAARY